MRPPRRNERAAPDVGQDAAEQIRRREVSRVLKKADLTPEQEAIVERLSRSLSARLLLGPVSGVLARQAQGFPPRAGRP